MAHTFKLLDENYFFIQNKSNVDQEIFLESA